MLQEIPVIIPIQTGVHSVACYYYLYKDISVLSKTRQGLKCISILLFLPCSEVRSDLLFSENSLVSLRTDELWALIRLSSGSSADRYKSNMILPSNSWKASSIHEWCGARLRIADSVAGLGRQSEPGPLCSWYPTSQALSAVPCTFKKEYEKRGGNERQIKKLPRL